MEATHMGKRTGAREFPTDAEVEELARRVIENFPPGAAQVLTGYGIDPRDGIRFHPVATRCREARERRGLTIKSAAHELRIPQYRLRDVENGQTNRIEPEVLARYLALLDLGRWFARWKAYNPELAAKLGATTIPGHGRTRASRRARPARGRGGAPVQGPAPGHRACGMAPHPGACRLHLLGPSRRDSGRHGLEGLPPARVPAGRDLPTRAAPHRHPGRRVPAGAPEAAGLGGSHRSVLHGRGRARRLPLRLR